VDAGSVTARERWAAELAAWAPPEELRASLPADDHRFDVARFARFADEATPGDDPSQVRVREVLPEDGVLLDVGCGAGAGSLPLVPPAAHVIGVDPQRDMLDAFEQRVSARGAAVTTVQGAWPGAAGRVGVADVAISRHVVYNVPDLTAFTYALSAHARRRVVIEMSERHPLDWTRRFWRSVHGVDRPDGPTCDDAVAALEEAGIGVAGERWISRHHLGDEPIDAQLASLRRHLMVGPDRDDELRALLSEHPPPTERPAAVLWWDT